MKIDALICQELDWSLTHLLLVDIPATFEEGGVITFEMGINVN